MFKRNRAQRCETLFSPQRMRAFSEECSAWFETQQAVGPIVSRGRRKAFLFAWVRVQMMILLTARERECIELYYFRGLTYRRAGEMTGSNASSVYRGVQRGLRRLRAAAVEDGLIEQRD